jgi:anti-sigma-K factor RskA
MRSDLEQAAYIEGYLLNGLDDVSRRAFEEKIAHDPEFAATVRAQQKAYSFVQRFYQRQEQLNTVFHSLMKESAFAAQIKTLFA